MDEARRHILQLVQDGHMSPDQAASVLEMMDRGRADAPPPSGWGGAPGGWPGPQTSPGFQAPPGCPPGPFGAPWPPPGPYGGPPPPPPPGPHGYPPPPPGPHGGPPPPWPPPGAHGGPPWGAPGHPPPPPGPHGPPPWPPGPPDPHQIAALVRDLGPQRARRVARAVAHGGQVVVSVASATGDVQHTRHEGHTALGDAREVMIDHAYGDLLVLAHDEETLAWVLDCETRGAAEPATVECEVRGERVVLKVRVPPQSEGTSSRATLEVRVPRRAEVRCESANGQVRASGLRGRVRIRSGNGAVAVTDHEGAFEITALNGPVSMREVRGDGDLRVENGRIDVEAGSGRWAARIANGAARVTRSQGRLRLDTEHGNVDIAGFEGELRLETTIGDVAMRDVGPDVIARCTRTGSVEATAPLVAEGRLELRAATGDVRLHVSGEPNGRFALQTSSGRIDCALSLEQVEQTAHAVTGSIGEPRAQVVLETVLGNVLLDRAD